MSLEFYTIFVSLIVIDISVAIIILFYILRIERNKWFINAFFLQRILETISFIGIGLRYKIPDFISIEIANVLLFISFYIQIISVTSFDGKLKKTLALVLGFFSFLASLLFILNAHNQLDRVIVQSSSIVILSLTAVFCLVKNRKNYQMPLLIAFGYFLYAAFNAFRALFLIVLQPENYEFTTLFLIDKIGILGGMYIILSTSVGFFMLINEIKQKTIETNNGMINTALEQSPVSVIITDLDRTIRYVNPIFEKRSGYSLSESKGLKPDILKSGLTPKETYKELNQKLKNGEVWQGEFVNRNKQGELYYEEAVIATIKDKKGEKAYHIAFKIDISENKRLLAQAKENEQKFRAIFEQAGVGMAVLNTQTGEFVRVNQVYCQFVQYSLEEMLERTFLDITHPEDSDTNLNSNFALIDGTLKTFSYDKRYIRKDKEIVWGRLTISPMWKDGEKPLVYYHIAIVEDITDRKRNELIINKQNTELKKLNTDKDRFMQILAHDLRNPFNALLGILDLLVTNYDKYSSEKIEKLLKLLHNSTYNTYNLLEDLLLWSKSQAGQLAFQPKEILLEEITKDVISTLQVIADSKNISLSYSEIGFILAFADLNMVKTILRNLISNAIKFTNSNGSVMVSVKLQNAMVEISVIDNGIGIDEETISKLWVLPHTTEGTSGERGTGLGLLLCKEFVERHGGKIWIESQVNKGSSFKFTLPIFLK